MKIIEIVVSPQGKSKVETKGFVGNSCQQASMFIESALGKRAEVKLKPEFHNQAEAENSLENFNGNSN